MSRPTPPPSTSPRTPYARGGPHPALIPMGPHAGRPAIALRRSLTLVGSAETAHVRLTSRSVDPAHALLVLSPTGTLVVRDLASHTGVLINDNPVTESQLQPDDLLQIGSFQFRVSLPTPTNVPAEVEVPPATLTLDDQPHPLNYITFLLGRREGADLLLSDPKSSRSHAVLVRVGTQYLIRDLGSRAGTLVNGLKVHERPLEPGDVIELASHTLTFDLAASPGATTADALTLDDSLSDLPPAPTAPAAAEDEDLSLDLNLDLPTPEPTADQPEDALPLEPGLAPDLEEPVASQPTDEEPHDAPIPLDLDLTTPEEPTPATEPVAETPTPDDDLLAPSTEPTEAQSDLPLPEATAEPEEAPLPIAETDDDHLPAEEPAPTPAAEAEPESPLADAPLPIAEVDDEPLPHETPLPVADLTPAPTAESPTDIDPFDLADPAPAADTEDAAEAQPLAAQEPLPLAEADAHPTAEAITAETPEADEDASLPLATDELPLTPNDESDTPLPVAEEADLLPESTPAIEAEAESPLPIAEADIDDLLAEPQLPTDEEPATPIAESPADAEPLADADAEPVAGVEAEPTLAETPAPAEEDPDLTPVANETEPHDPDADLAHTPFLAAADDEAAPEPDPIPFTFGPDRALNLFDSPVSWHAPDYLGPIVPTPPPELSLAGGLAFGTVDGLDRLPDTLEDAAAAPPTAEIPADQIDRPEDLALAEDEATSEPPPPGERLLGVIRVAAPTTEADIEPVASVVEPAPLLAAEDTDEDQPAPTAVDLPLATDDDARPGQDAPAPAGADAPDSLHAVKPPPAAYGVSRGLSSLTGGGRAVDVFSQMKVLTDDPVLGQIAGPAAAIPPFKDPALSAAPAAAELSSDDDVARALQIPQAGFDSPESPAAAPQAARSAPPAFVRKIKRLFRDNGGRPLSVAAAMLLTGAAVYGLTPTASLVRAEVHYRNYDHLPGPAKLSLELRQRALLTDPAVLATAADSVVRIGPGLLADSLSLSKVIDDPQYDLWPESRPGTMVISVPTHDPDGDSLRLRALTRALVDAPANKDLIAKAAEAADKATAARHELATLDHNIAQLEQRLSAQARLASASAEGDVSATAPEPSAPEKAWRDASLATLKAQADVADLADRKVPDTDPKMKDARARLAAARTREAAARDQFLATTKSAVAASDETPADPQRAAAETAVALRTLRAQRQTKEADVKTLQRQADTAAVYPELPATNDGVWVTTVPDHRRVYAAGSALIAGVAVSGLLSARARRG